MSESLFQNVEKQEAKQFGYQIVTVKIDASGLAADQEPIGGGYSHLTKYFDLESAGLK